MERVRSDTFCLSQRSTSSELSTVLLFWQRLVYVFEQAGAQARLLSVLLRFHYMVDAYGDVADKRLKFVMCTTSFAPFVLVQLVVASD